MFKYCSMKPIVQISLDLTNIDEALETAALAMRAGVDWLEATDPCRRLAWCKKITGGFPGYSHCSRFKNHGWRLS